MNKKYPEEFKIEAVKQAIAWLMLPTVYERNDYPVFMLG